jgi:hypothetical protein
MFKRDVTYEDFDGDKVTETFYFNLTKTELIELEVEYKGGLKEALERIIKAQDNKMLVAEFKRIVLLAYGIKSDDGKRFVKSDALREEFSQTAAYDALFMELAMDSDSAAAFINGIVPKDFAKEIEKAAAGNGSPPAIMPKAPTG